MKSINLILLCLIIASNVCAVPKSKSQTLSGVEGKPNILIIFTDDQGYADLGCYGNKKNRTPRLDQFAKEGMLFTNFYAQPVCGLSRSALLTGRYPIRSKGWSMPADEITFAELAKPAGCQTACIGKWDVSNRKPIIDRMPNAQGFDYYFGTLGANDNGMAKFHENNEPAGETTDMASFTRLYTDKAIDYLENRRNPKQPFVLYVAHTMMHTVIDASPKFKRKSKGGLYGDVVEEFDYETGRLLDKLDELGLSENTLVVYTTDNGPWCQSAYTEAKMGFYPEKTKGKNADWYQDKGTIFWGEPGKLRGGKGSAYEGGSRVPCIVRWPGKVPANKKSDAIFATIDIMPTLAGLCGFEIPNDRVIDGVNQTSLILGKTTAGRKSFVYDQSKNIYCAGIRKGKWKMLVPNRKPEKEHFFLMDFGTNDYELYNLDRDIREKKNLVDKHPEIVEELKNELIEFKNTVK